MPTSAGASPNPDRGRILEGRRWSDGLHQAVEAKEKVTIEPENQTLASITFQNYFRMYPKLSGMTGTAATEAAAAGAEEVLLVDADTYGGAVAHATIQEHHRNPAALARSAAAQPPCSTSAK